MENLIFYTRGPTITIIKKLNYNMKYLIKLKTDYDRNLIWRSDRKFIHWSSMHDLTFIAMKFLIRSATNLKKKLYYR